MDVKTKFPLTHTALQQIAMPGMDKVPMPGSFNDFLYLLDAAEFSVEYQPNELILMSYASPLHEQIVANLLGIFYLLYRNEAKFQCYGSNRPVYIPELGTSYNPDAAVVFGAPEYHEYLPGRFATLNPWLVVEVLSPGTERYDWQDKLRRYKKINALEYILYVEQDYAYLTLHFRDAETHRWASMDYDSMEQHFQIWNQAISIGDIYAKVDFNAK